ncbi:MAG: hypothetical protein R3F30_01655 [Planctomycetota bacterium]
MPEGRSFLPAGSAEDASTGRIHGCKWTTVLAVTGLLLPLTGCVTESRPLPAFDDPAGLSRVEVKVFDPAGTEVDRAVVGPEPILVGRSSGRPWNLTPAEAAAGQDGAQEARRSRAAYQAPGGPASQRPTPSTSSTRERTAGPGAGPGRGPYARFGPARRRLTGGVQDVLAQRRHRAVFEQLLALSSAQKATAHGAGLQVRAKQKKDTPLSVSTPCSRAG